MTRGMTVATGSFGFTQGPRPCPDAEPNRRTSDVSPGETVLDFRHARSFQGAIALLLLLLQANLLLVAELHRHGAMEVRAAGTSTVREESHQPLPIVEQKLLCTVCQIVRHCAALPTKGNPAPKPAACLAFRAPLHSSAFHSHQPAMVYGRAPPLA